MFKRIILFCLLVISTASFAKNPPEYSILPNVFTEELLRFDPALADWYEYQAIELVKRNLNTTGNYSTVKIGYVYGGYHRPKSLIVYLFSSHIKTFEIVKIDLTQDFTVSSMTANYKPTRDDMAQSPNYVYRYTPKCPDSRVQFVIGNVFKGDESVEKEVQAVYQDAKNNGYNPVLMDINDPQGPQPTVHAYEDWMSCPNVKGFYNESHGFEQGIALEDDMFLYTLVDRDLVNKLRGDMVMFDSCSTFQEPLLDSMTSDKKGNAQKYMAGFVPLPFGPSERTASCFWKAAIINHAPLTQSVIVDCAIKSGLEPYSFRIKGNGGNYLRPAT